MLSLADPRQAPLDARRARTPRRSGLRGERAAERLVDVRDVADRLDRQLARLLVELLVVDGDDALVVLVQVDRPVCRRQNGLLDRGLKCLLAAPDVALHGLEALDQAPRVDEEAVGEGRRRLRRRGTER